MSEFSRETLLNIIETDHVQCGEASALARMALVAMGSEPVAQDEREAFEAFMAKRFGDLVDQRRAKNGDHGYMAWDMVVAWIVWQSRAAMLQAGTLTNEDTKQAWTGIPDIDNAINMLDRIDTLESCDDDRIEAVKTVLRGLAGNYPVITDSSADMLRRWLAFGRGMQNAGSQLPHNLIAETEEMLAAADCSIPMISDRWVPVSERMPDVGVKVLCFPVKDEPIHATFNGQLWLQDISWSGSEEPIDNIIPVTVTHWMPLPAAPREVK